MKKSITFLLLSFVIIGTIISQTTQYYTNPVGKSINGVADPFVMLYNGQYYLFGTTSNDGFVCYTSPDMVNWTSSGYAYQETSTSYGDNTYWAAEVKNYNGKFYMTYSCKGKNNANGGRMLLCLAVSNSPTGPYTDLYAPWFDNGYSCIDADLFIDTDGEPYLYFDIVGSRGYVFGELYMRKLSKTDLTITGDTVFVSRTSQPWENPTSNSNRTNEGSFVFKYNNKYFMTYSANHYADPNYGIGYQTADSPYGPWTKSVRNPIVAKDSLNGIFGPGHNSFAYSPDGNELFIAYHTQISYTNKARQLNIDRVYIDEQYNLTILGPTRSPQAYPTSLNSGISVNTSGISVDPTSASLMVGSTTTKLTATVTPTNATLKFVTWLSSNPAIATVNSSGVVTPVGYGTTNIIARTYEGGKTAYCVVTVDTISVTGVSLNPTTLTCNVKGITSALTATILPANASFKTIIWSSSNTAVAIVSSSGVVTPVGDGIAIITATTADGSKKATCSVSVAISPKLTVNPTSLDFGNVTVNTVSPEKTYIINGSNLSSVVTINVPSGYEISRSSGTGFGTSLTLTASSVSNRTVYIRFKPTSVQIYNGNITNASTGITTLNLAVTGASVDATNLLNVNQDIFTIYPNPAKDQIFIDLPLDNAEVFKIYLINTLGMILKTHEVSVITGINSVHIDVNDLSAGVYFIRTNLKEKTITKKIIIEKY